MKIKHNTSFCSCLYEKQSLRRVCLWAFTEAFCYFVSVIAGQSRWSFPAEHCLLPSTRGTEAGYGTSRDGSCTQKQCVSTGMLCSSRVSGTGSSVVALVTLVCLGFVLLVSQPQFLVLWVFRMRAFWSHGAGKISRYFLLGQLLAILFASVLRTACVVCVVCSSFMSTISC